MEAGCSPYRADTTFALLHHIKDLHSRFMQEDAYRRYFDRNAMEARLRDSSAIDPSHSVSGKAGDRQPRWPSPGLSTRRLGHFLLKCMDRVYRPSSYIGSIVNPHGRANGRRTELSTAKKVCQRTESDLAQETKRKLTILDPDLDLVNMMTLTIVVTV